MYVSLAALKYLKRAPHFLSVLKIRHATKLDKKLPTKEEIPQLVAKILNIDFPYVYGKRGAFLPENYDMADAINCGLAWIKLQQRKPIKSKKKINESKSSI